MINVCKYGYKPEYGILIDTTSKSKTWSKQLSPFYLGPVYLACGIIAKNVENAWQFSKVYKHQIDSCGNPSELWYKWSMIGMNDNYAHRYPMGKNATPEYTYYNKEKLSYIEARKKVYIPLYTQAVIKTEAYRNLVQTSKQNDIWLMDFDGYDYKSLGMNINDVLNCESKKMGHAFVLAMLLEYA